MSSNSGDLATDIRFKTRIITSISDRTARVRNHFIILGKMEEVIVDNPNIIHKGIIVELDDGSLYLMEFSSLYINMTFWLFNVSFGESINIGDVYDISSATKGSFQNAMDKVISKFIKLGHNLDKFNLIGTVKEKIIRMSRFYGEVVANTFSLFDVLAFESRDLRFAELFSTKLDSNAMTISEIENFLEAATNRLYDVIIDDKQSSMYPFIVTDIVKKLQMGQMFVAVGARYDIDKTILPRLIEKGWMHGMQTISEFFAEAVSTRNSIIVKKEAVPDSGYLSRKVNICCLNTHTDSRIFDCGTKHYLPHYVADESHLKLLEGKYRVVDPITPIVREINVTDTDLIGTTIHIRSHTKCITGHKLNKVCSICLGNKHTSLSDVIIGGLVSIKLINPITQLGLSAKHASKTNSEDITGNIFDRYFSISKSSSIFPRKDICSKRNVQLLVPLEIANDIISSDSSITDGEVDEGLNFAKNIDIIYVVEDGVLRGLDLNDKNFYLSISDNLVNIISDGNGSVVRTEDVVTSIAEIESINDTNWDIELQDMEFFAIDFSNMDPTESIFNAKLLTEEVSKYLRITKSIIDGSKTSTYTRPEEMVADIVDVIMKAGIRYHGMMIHIETLIMNLTRSMVDNITRVDFSQEVEPEVRFVKLTQAIQKSDLFSGIVFQDLKRQFELSDTLKKKTPGIYDIFFKNSVFLENGIEFRKTRPYLYRDEQETTRISVENANSITPKRRRK